MKAFAENLSFVMPEKAAQGPTLTPEEEASAQIIKYGVRIKDEPGRATRLHPNDLRRRSRSPLRRRSAGDSHILL